MRFSITRSDGESDTLEAVPRAFAATALAYEQEHDVKIVGAQLQRDEPLESQTPALGHASEDEVTARLDAIEARLTKAGL